MVSSYVDLASSKQEKDDAFGLWTFPLKKLINVFFNVMTYFSIMVFEAPSSYFSFRSS
jgi:hypothetical protein